MKFTPLSQTALFFLPLALIATEPAFNQPGARLKATTWTETRVPARCIVTVINLGGVYEPDGSDALHIYGGENNNGPSNIHQTIHVPVAEAKEAPQVSAADLLYGKAQSQCLPAALDRPVHGTAS